MPKSKLPFKEFTWTPELAYAIGLLVTDGNLSRDGRHITMRSSDYNLLETFKFCLNLKTEIKQTYNDGFAKKPSFRVQFSDAQFYRWLLSIGLFPAKTYTIAELAIPDLYFRDFLRGHLDGDGSITVYKDYYNTFKDPKYIYNRLWLRFISSSGAHIMWLQKRIKNLLRTKGHIAQGKIQRPDQTTGLWMLKFGKKESVKILSWIYYHPDVPCLKRKRIIAEKALEISSKEKRRDYTRTGRFALQKAK